MPNYIFSMKVKNEAYLLSLTALLRQNFKNSSNPNEQLWYATVPSITYIWTHRPQWRRRHKNRKKSKTHPLPSITSRINEDDLWDTLKPLESRPCSRSSTSPYETCSSRPIVTESESTRNDDVQRNREVFSLSSNQRSQSFDRKLSICETRSDSKLRRSRGSQLARLIRSQKRLGIRNSTNSQNTVGTLSSLEVNKSMQLLVGRDLLSDCSIPKRRVTFSNYVSENSVTDTRSQISATMNDNDPREASWWQRSYSPLTDDEDNFSLQTNLSCLFSSMIFDDSKSSFFSLTTSPDSERSKKSDTPLNRECSESIFYVNASYSNASSCNLVSFPKICSNDDYPERNGDLIENSHRDIEVLTKLDELQGKRSDEKISKQIVPDIKTLREINTDPTYNRSIECITIELKDISSTVKELSIESGNDSDKRRHYESLSKNHISTDTSDLIVLNIIRSLASVTQLLNNDINNRKMSVNEIFSFLQQPKDQIDAAFLLKELSKVGAETFGNYNLKKEIANIDRIRECDVFLNSRKKADNVGLLRIDAATFGECESVLIEMEVLDDSVQEKELLKKSSSLKIHNFLQEPCESLVGNLAGINKHSELVASSSSNFHNEYTKCSTVDKCCLICGRRKTENPRYLRPVCQVKGMAPISRLENDPWINVMNKVIKHDNGKESMPPANRTSKNLNPEKDRQSCEESSKDSNANIHKNSINELSLFGRNESASIVEKVEEECFSTIITDAENSSPSMATVDSSILSSRDQSTSCPPEPERCSSTSFGFAAFRGPRTQSAKTYFMRESLRTVEGTANRLLCVISESDSLMAVPPFLPKKPPDWFGRQMPTRKWSRR